MKGSKKYMVPTNGRTRNEKEIFMEFFFVILSVALTLGFCWLIDRENFARYVAAVLFIETCTIFWIILPK